MNFYKILIAAFSATNIMTTFSYLVSISFKKLFKEPVMLNFILEGAGINLKGRMKKVSGWLAHYLIGFAFVLVYESVWHYTNVKFGFVSGIAFGIISGVVGVSCWRLIYRLPDGKRHVPSKEYGIQLFFGHIVFAVAVVVAFKIFNYDPLSHIY
ncbi:hypothetical protein HYN59_02780 [Flavobacterium album]|uniref:DUF2938 domain-containing protein n=1 Tax=Flavobacterium album TaxID=2175091 RepID=A0A2S1QUU4_9FLAO|nr:hypothetical protein [Flavobacterium album]AWH84099.1 hypothetical protein HYN59_02780 [Flavobacterium album]